MANAKTQKKRNKKNGMGHSGKGFNSYPVVGNKVISQGKALGSTTNYHNKIG